MNQSIISFLSFIKKNRIIIYVLLGTALMLQICSKGAQQAIRSPEPQYKEITQPAPQDELLPHENSETEKPPGPANNLNSLLIMTAILLALFVARRYGWLDKMLPKVVIFKVNHYKNKTTGHLILRVFLINRTSTSITFNNPTLCFFKGNKKRAFIIKNIGGQNYFPITLTPGTGHKFNIDAQKFYDNVEGLTKYKTLRMEINSTTGTTYKSIKWPSWLTFKRIG
ncbi:hypothetical protein SAMN06265379_105121 [Saccharicrinis carchari]|uniref:Uncharacterized protein n=1 Tax=Saccharicrinis carchari TaxID=1168039 RepID=A0A521DE22_SACCC|nr:hypothetical protein [Saccharicrinis carchari]SMO69977.1 hypothetical protein SAMN06265379_105121 [Saccharicrinis carchari]